MDKRFSTIIMLLFLSTAIYGQCEIPIIFEHPRDGIFKWHSGGLDHTSVQHGLGSFMLVGFTFAILKSQEVENSAVWAGAGVLGLGFLKEVEDGFREGFSLYDMGCNLLGCSVGAVLLGFLDYKRSNVNVHASSRNVQIKYMFEL